MDIGNIKSFNMLREIINLDRNINTKLEFNADSELIYNTKKFFNDEVMWDHIDTVSDLDMWIKQNNNKN
jgi:hypothetical protein